MDFQTVRIYGSLVVIMGCFIFLYPKLLHPMVLSVFGLNAKSEVVKENDFIPPPLRNQHQHVPNSKGKPDIPENIKNMRHGPHPGMRAAAADQGKQTRGSGRGGMMSVILPMYAIGIVVYLVYTLTKVFGKKDKKDGSDQQSPTHQPKSPVYEDVPLDDEEEMDIRKLQERLAETESQMTKILMAMQSVQNKMGDVSVQPAQGNNSANASESGKKEATEKESNDQSSESTPDSDSFEIVNKSDRESSGEETGSQSVETLLPETVDSDDTEPAGDQLSDQGKQEEDGQDEEEVLLDAAGKKEVDEEDTTVRKRHPNPLPQDS
ncbi:resistance to inhibitors of cholinesterase protein 3-like isoform X2 [Mya arenaria]|uniref:resistance to inhibitors of cholinesterase protein 3-like isoform X2 n=1 Tax=Mya arenaria TaxID=6604 RepID=UPI0022DFE7DF|nr:resistance to inhibitors of cholinesterase protein 3-like isoform X2 [Mya arenaria]